MFSARQLISKGRCEHLPYTAQLLGLVGLVVLVMMALAAIRRAGVFTTGSARVETFPYRKKDYLLSRAERSFYEVLRTAVGEEWTIFVKVRLLDLVWLPRGTSNAQSHRNRVQSKHVDFVLSDPRTIGPVLVIELDDASHRRSDRQRRDAFVDAVLQGAGLPILHVAVRSGYVTADLSRQIRAAIGSTPLAGA